MAIATINPATGEQVDSFDPYRRRIGLQVVPAGGTYLTISR